MIRSFHFTAMVLTTVVIAAGSTTFGDSKARNKSGGFNRGQVINNGGQTSGSFSGRLGNLSGGKGNGLVNSGNAGSGNGNVGASGFPSGFGQQLRGTKLPVLGNSGGNLLDKKSHHVELPGRLNGSGQPQVNITLPSNLQNRLGHAGNTVLLPNGTKTKAIAFNVAQILNHKVHTNQMQPQIQNIVKTAPKHLCVQPHFSWWVDVCHHHCHTHYGSWNVHNQYWDCWTPCSWQVVQCEKFSYYVGLSCIHIPDMQAYGVQSVINGSPAHLAGLQTGDLILTVNGQSVFDPGLINAELVRGRLDLQVIREGFASPIQLSVFPRLVQNVSF